MQQPFHRQPGEPVSGGAGSASLFWRASLTALVVCAASPAGQAQVPAEPATPARAAEAPQLEARGAALQRAKAAVVGVEVTAVDDAGSAATLGRRRSGSGVVVADDGLVLTIGYLILEADHVDIVLDEGKRIPARVVNYDLASGLGLLRPLVPTALAPAPLGASAGVPAHEPLLVVSGGGDAALGLTRLVSRRPFSGYWEYHIEGALFTAPARPEHSGAGLFDADGELIGIGSLAVSKAAGPGEPELEGNMFVPVDLIKPVLDEIRAHGSAAGSERAWLGVNCVEYGGSLRVVRLTPDGPADAAGIRPGDVIAAIDGRPVSELAPFYEALWRGGAAERNVVLDVRRGAESLQVTVRTVDRSSRLSRPRGV